MLVLRNPKTLQQHLKKIRSRGLKIGFVPTMGFLHEGHLSLVRRSKKENDVTVASIFVNPLQFGPKEDFKSYPRNGRRDRALLKRENCDILFMPNGDQMFSPAFETAVSVRDLSKPLCGETRPTHFTGVTTIVAKLLNLVGPDSIYLGQKDYQQLKVIEKMISDLNIPVKACMSPIIREIDGLAMSSRNVRLTQAQRHQAPLIRQALIKAKKLVSEGQTQVAPIIRSMRQILSSALLARIDYVEIVDADTLKPVVELSKRRKVLAAIALYFGSTRLIDNELIEGKK